MSTLVLPPRYDQTAIGRLFTKRRFSNLFGLRRSRPVKTSPDGMPLSIELVWMPAYVFSIAVSRGKKRNTIWASVDATFGGEGVFFQRMGELREQEVTEEVFPVVIDPEEAEQGARAGMIRFILRKRGAKPHVDSVEGYQHYYAPMWVYYFRGRNEKMGVAVRDGYTGDPVGGRMMQAILNGIIEKHQEPS